LLVLAFRRLLDRILFFFAGVSVPLAVALFGPVRRDVLGGYVRRRGRQRRVGHGGAQSQGQGGNGGGNGTDRARGVDTPVVEVGKKALGQNGELGSLSATGVWGS
jgi:hypothetical protein